MQAKQDWVIGDCLEVMQEYPDNYFDLILTDPPYGVNICNNGVVGFGVVGKNKLAPLKDYNVQIWDKERLERKYFDEMLRVSKNQIVFGGNYYTDYIPVSSCWIIWDKDNTGNFADCEMAWTSFDTAVRLYKYRWNGMLQDNMKKKEDRVHPTQKPVPLFEWILKNYTKAGDKILDPFCGSDTTVEACMNLDLECLVIDISAEWVPHYKQRLRLHDNKLEAYL